MSNPLFCPHAECDYHYPPVSHPNWFVRRGHYDTLAFGPVQRYCCKGCGKGFSDQTFRLDYYIKRPISYLRVLHRLTSGCGIRAAGRHLAISHQAILNRLSRLARQALAIHATLNAHIELNEDLATDGFESFVGSQYHPNNIHILLGSESQHLYCFDYAHLRRKGRMTEYQRQRRALIERRLIRKRISIYQSFSRIVDEVERLVHQTSQVCTVLYSDIQKEYPRALKASPPLGACLAEGRLIHSRISSKRVRTRNNPLFPVNYFDRQLRKDCANHVRETVQFSRNVNNCLEHLAIYQLQHNYRKPFRIDIPVLRDLRHAEVAGVPRERIDQELSDVFTRRRFLTHLSLSFSQALVWLRMVGTLDHWDGGYSPKYVWM